MIELFAKTDHGEKWMTIFKKKFIIDVWQSFRCAYSLCSNISSQHIRPIFPKSCFTKNFFPVVLQTIKFFLFNEVISSIREVFCKNVTLINVAKIHKKTPVCYENLTKVAGTVSSFLKDVSISNILITGVFVRIYKIKQLLQHLQTTTTFLLSLVW